MDPSSSLLDFLNQAAPQRTINAPSELVAPQRTTSAPSELVPERTMSAPAGNGATDEVAIEVDGNSPLLPAFQEVVPLPRGRSSSSARVVIPCLSSAALRDG